MVIKICILRDHDNYYSPWFVNMFKCHSTVKEDTVNKFTKPVEVIRYVIWIMLDYMEQDLLTLPEHLDIPQIFSRFMLLNV
jgi:hypothetical protein